MKLLPKFRCERDRPFTHGRRSRFNLKRAGRLGGAACTVLLLILSAAFPATSSSAVPVFLSICAAFVFGMSAEKRGFRRLLRSFGRFFGQAPESGTPRPGLADRVYRNTSEAVIVTDNRSRILSTNPAFSSITGYSEREVLKKSPAILRSNRHDQEFYQTMWKSIRTRGKWEGEIWDRKKNGEVFPQWLLINTISDDETGDTFYVGIFHDITELKAREAAVEHNSYYDQLTDLPNRHLFLDRLKLALSKRERTQGLVCLMMIDLDNFKEVNDVIGFTSGDQIIRETAAAIGREIRQGDTLGRMEEHEFSLLLTDIHHPEQVSEIAERIVASFRNGFAVNGRTVHISPSIGISISPDDGKDPRTLLACADLALLRAKSHDRKAYHFFTADLNIRAQKRFELENNLRQAVADDSMNICYQPIVDLGSGKITGCEALARMVAPDNISISPSLFIPVAEETGIIISLGEWMLKASCTAVKRWQQFYPEIHIAVNLSARQFLDHNLLLNMKRIFRETGLNPENVVIEITENSLIHDIDESIKVLFRLKEMGVRISVDDFGTGYSSLVYLKKLPIDILKIDRSFIQDIRKDCTNLSDLSIVTAIISMAHKLGLSVVAEGIETTDQLEFLISSGCHYGQGFLFSQPVPGDTMEMLLRERHTYETKAGELIREDQSNG